MAKLHKYGALARDLYLKGHSPEAIAGQLPVSAKTVRQWADYHGWDKERRLKVASGRQLAERMEELIHTHIAALEEKPELTPGDLDGLQKMYGVLERVRRGTFAFSAAAVETFDRFARWLNAVEGDKAFLERLADHVRNFMAQVEG